MEQITRRWAGRMRGTRIRSSYRYKCRRGSCWPLSRHAQATLTFVASALGGKHYYATPPTLNGKVSKVSEEMIAMPWKSNPPWQLLVGHRAAVGNSIECRLRAMHRHAFVAGLCCWLAHAMDFQRGRAISGEEGRWVAEMRTIG